LKEIAMIQRKICYRFTKAVFTLATAALCSVSLLADTENERITNAGQVG